MHRVPVKPVWTPSPVWAVRVLAVLAALTCAWLLDAFHPERWFSITVAHRQQVEALLSGTFALSQDPRDLRPDWAWDNGAQQVWGLLVPAWRLPLDAMARVFGARGFPDRLALWLGVVLAMTVVAGALKRAVKDERAHVAALVALLAVPPAWNVLRTSMRVYEEASLAAMLACLVVGALVVRAAANDRGRNAWLLGLWAGVVPLARPTLLFAGVAATVVMLVMRRWKVLPGFLAGTALVLGVNHVRFGDALETGQRLNVSVHVPDQAAKVFGYPFLDEPMVTAFRELLGTLALEPRWVAPPAWFSADLHAMQSTTLRFRELYFTPFGTPWLLLACVLGWMAWRAWSSTRDAAHGALLAWCGLTLAPLLVFYAWAPTASSRYLLDLVGPLAWMVALGAAALFARARMAAVGALAVMVATVLTGRVSPVYAGRMGTSHAGMMELMERPAHDGPVPDLPTVMRCGDRISDDGLRFQGVGWDVRRSCTVQAAVTLVAPARACVRLVVEPAPGASLTRLGLDGIRVARRGRELPRITDTGPGASSTLVFCGEREEGHPIALFTLGTVHRSLLHPDVRPFVLRSVEFTEAP